MFINNNFFNSTSSGFLNYNIIKPPQQNIDVENDLRGAIRNNSKCPECKIRSLNN